MGEIVISSIIFGMVSVIMIGIGISQIKSKDPVGFYTGEKPPQKETLADVGQWNKRHGRMWMVYGCFIICSYLSGIFISNSLYSLLIVGTVIFGGIPFMMWYHGKLKRKYII